MDAKQIHHNIVKRRLVSSSMPSGGTRDPRVVYVPLGRLDCAGMAAVPERRLGQFAVKPNPYRARSNLSRRPHAMIGQVLSRDSHEYMIHAYSIIALPIN